MAKAARSSGHCGIGSGSPRGTRAALHRRRSLYDRLRLGFEPLELRRLLAIDNWIGGAAGDWNVAGNWDNGVPQPGDAVSIPIGNTVNYNSTSDIAIANTISGAGTLSITTTGAVTQNSGDSISVATLTLNAGTGITLNDPGNAIGSFAATNSTSGDISLTNDATLTINGITDHGGGAITIANTGAVTVTAAIGSTGVLANPSTFSPIFQQIARGPVSTSSSGPIKLTAAGNDVAMNIKENVTSPDANMTLFATGDLTVGNGVTLDAGPYALNLGADGTLSGGGNGIGTLSIDGNAHVYGLNHTTRSG